MRRFEISAPGAPLERHTAMKANPPESCAMPGFEDQGMRADILNRLKRAEGQLRGIQRMVEAGEPCLDIATQMAAVRKALDSTYSRMTVCFIEQELSQQLGMNEAQLDAVGKVLEDVQTLLGKVR